MGSCTLGCLKLSKSIQKIHGLACFWSRFGEAPRGPERPREKRIKKEKDMLLTEKRKRSYMTVYAALTTNKEHQRAPAERTARGFGGFDTLTI